MVTIKLIPRPIPRTEVRCNACDKLIGHLTDEARPYLETAKDFMGNFRRMRLYDVKNDGEHLHDHEYEVDFCAECGDKFDNVIEKFGLNKSQVKILEAEA